MSTNAILNLSFDFALNIINYTSILEENKRYVVAKQLLKSGTSIGANIREAQNAESKNDFIHKFKIAAKEADETEYWLLLCKESGYADCSEMLVEIKSIIKVITKIISSCKRRSI
jgi:four helix bundle protein